MIITWHQEIIKVAFATLLDEGAGYQVVGEVMAHQADDV